MYLFKTGGILMYLIFFLGVIGIYAILERTFYFSFKERKNFSKIPTEIRNLIKDFQIKEAIVRLNSNKSSTASVLKEILMYGYKENKESLSALEEKGKEKAIEQIKLLERNMWLLSIAAHASPLLGLLGTVTGMIKAFQAIALHGTGDAGILAKGISEALYTTAGGLVVAIPCMIFYNYFNRKIDLIISDIEKLAQNLSTILGVRKMKLERMKRRSGGDLILELTPLIDVVFLLLIFFMLATTFDASSTFKIELPKTSAKKNIDVVRDVQLLIDKDKNMYISYKENSKSINEKVNISNLVAKMSEKLKSSSKKEVIISADKKIDYGYVVEIMGLTKEAGAEAINIDTAIKR